MIAKIAVSAANFAIDKPYSYCFPEEMAIRPGIRVLVPFGKGNHMAEGVVLAVEAGTDPKLKSVNQLMDEEPLLSESFLRLAAFMHERYFCTFYDAIRAMLPAGLWFETKQSFSLIPDSGWEDAQIRQPEAKLIVQLLRDCGGQSDERVLRDAVPDEAAFQKAIAYLQRKKWLQTRQDYRRKTGDKTEAVAVLTAAPEEAMAYAQSRPRSAAMQRSILELLCSMGSVSVKELCYFTGAKPATVKRLAELGFVALQERPVFRCREIRPTPLEGELILNEEQQQVLTGLQALAQAERPGVALLYGVTGSGKTAIYIKLISDCLARGKSALLLVPEIALTPQLLGLMAAYFGDAVAVLHSSLSAGERYDQWKRIRSGEAKVVVGTRSAVFAPCFDPGIIILDEEQEHSYKSENAPRYSAKEIAIWRGVKENALVLLGSATPSIETMYRAKQGDYALFTMTRRYNGRTLPKVRIVDMRRQVEEGNDLSFSFELQDAIRETADRGKQTILFLNRRGNSRALVCVSCGDAPECPRCSARLTYHSANERLMCHYCGYSQPVPDRCPSCGGYLKRVGVGTQKAQQELEALFPDLQSIRMDADTVNAINTHEKILSDFQKNHTPVLIGTQMVAKGLNLPDVTMVGVLDADLGLYSEGFRGAETTFAMLTQVVGRAGRGDSSGEAIVQTLVPEHQVLKLAARQDYDGFYELEINVRRVQSCPPFGDIGLITFTGQEEAKVLRSAALFRDSLRKCLKQPGYENEICTVLGPAPCPVPKINYHFRYRLTLRCRATRPLRLLLAHLLRQFSLDRNNRDVTVFADINGYE